MKKLIQTTIITLGVSVVLTLFSFSSFTTTVKAFCNTGWNRCTNANGSSAGSSPGDRRGCSVRTYSPFDSGDITAYVYTCSGRETTCYYVHRCTGDLPEDPPQF